MHIRTRCPRGPKPTSRAFRLETLEDRCVPTILSAPPQILLTPGVLTHLRQLAADNTPQWQAFKARLDSNLPVLIAEDIGQYEGEQLTYIADYALGYQILKDSDPATAANYADKAIGLMKSGLNDYQARAEVTRQFLARGDGSTRSFTLPNADFIPSSLGVYTSAIVVNKVVHGSANGQDVVGDYLDFLKVSNTPDGPASFARGTDWAQNGDYAENLIDWSPAGQEPAVGATYYVTSSSGLYANSTSAYTLDGSTITFTRAPAKNQAVYVEYIYGTHSSDGSTLAYQQTSAGDGGFNSIFIDDSYSARYLGRYLATGLDWLDGYVGMTQAFEQRVADMLVRWADYVKVNGYYSTSPSSNYGDGDYASAVMTGLALAPRDSADGPRLLDDAIAWRQTYLLPVLQNPTTSLSGGFWVEGWNYGNNAAQAILVGSLALETAGLITATPEHQWANQVMDSLLEEQSAPGLIYDSGNVYQYPFHLLDKDLFFTLSATCAGSVERSYANYVIQNFPDSAFGFETPSDFRDLLFHDPSGPAAFWSDLPLQNFASGTGLLTARSDWGTTPTWLAAQIGNQLPNTDHQFDPGQVEINRGADQLLINAAQVEFVYGSDSLGPDQMSQLGNLVVVNDHGVYERSPPNMGTSFGSPGVVDLTNEGAADHAYLYADYHAAYSTDANPGDGGPTSELTRQVVYVRPGYIFVFDRVTTLRASFTKQLRWQFANPPKVKGNTFVETAGSSKLFGETFSTVPLATRLSSFRAGSGGESFRVERLDTQNVTPTRKVRYVTTFEVAPSTTHTMDASRHVLSTNASMEGSQIGNQVVLFGRDGDLSADTVVTYSFTGTDSVNHLLTNLLPGASYEVIAGGTTTPATSSDLGTLEFTTAAGVGKVTVMTQLHAMTHLVLHVAPQVPARENFTASIDVVDAGGNLRTDFTGSVVVALTGSSRGKLRGITSVEVQNGVGTFSLLSLSAPGAYALSPSSGDLNGPTASVTAVAVPLAAHFVLTGVPASSVAGDTFSIVVTAYDAFNHVVSGFAGTVHFTSTDTQFGRPDDYVFTAADMGSHTFTVSLNTVGVQSITVADVTYPTARGTSRKVKISAGNGAAMVLRAFRLADTKDETSDTPVR
jgi:hypothetical protein